MANVIPCPKSELYYLICFGRIYTFILLLVSCMVPITILYKILLIALVHITDINQQNLMSLELSCLCTENEHI